MDRRGIPVVVAMKGHPGSGKSTIARSLAQALKWPLLDKDDVRDSTLPIQNLLPSSSSGGLLNDLSYAVIWGMADTQLQLGVSVVIDSPLSRPHLFHQIAALAAEHGALLLVVECRAADSQEWRRRLEDRTRASPSWHKPSSWEALQELVEGYQGCYEYDMGTTRRLVVDTTAKVEGEAIAAEVLNWVRRADHEGTPTLTFVPSEN